MKVGEGVKNYVYDNRYWMTFAAGSLVTSLVTRYLQKDTLVVDAEKLRRFKEMDDTV